jgi:hypothetical protein
MIWTGVRGPARRTRRITANSSRGGARKRWRRSSWMRSSNPTWSNPPAPESSDSQYAHGDNSQVFSNRPQVSPAIHRADGLPRVTTRLPAGGFVLGKAWFQRRR